MKQITAEFFKDLTAKVFKSLSSKEHLTIALKAEGTQYLRVNQSKVRQTGFIEDAVFQLNFVTEVAEASDPHALKRVTADLGLSGQMEKDLDQAVSLLQILRDETAYVPLDKYATLPMPGQSSYQERLGKLLPLVEVPNTLLVTLPPTMDLVGIYAAGKNTRGLVNSAGQFHWFSNETFSFDYSLFSRSQRALKATYAAAEWSTIRYRAQLQNLLNQFNFLEMTPKKLGRGKYNTYLAPHAVANLLQMFSWHGIGESYLRQGESPFQKVRKKEVQFSPAFELVEDFRGGDLPRFNEEGELAPETLTLISGGNLVNTLVSTRTAKEYGVPSTAAQFGERMQAPTMREGLIQEKDILTKIQNGLYISRLHYLNWSDKLGGRVTGMTRYGCFWIEKGKLVGPIENLRFDDSLFHIFGSHLIGLTEVVESVPRVDTYGFRELGRTKAPGIFVKDMEFTL